MSEKEKEMEEKEVEILDHWSHEHPLKLIQTRRGDQCSGCRKYFIIGDQGYGCSNKCGYQTLLHEECAEMARKIRHPLHPQHTLIQQYNKYLFQCAICEKRTWGIGYYCTSSDCTFRVHVGCVQDSSVMVADDDEQSRAIQHRSHPHHQLRLLRRDRGSYSIKCHACGTTQIGNSYLCIICQYWIHQKCASLPDTMKREDHHHPLSLSFRVPSEYMIFDYKCDVCHGDLLPKYWIYHCQLCKYVVHIKCAFKKSLHATTTNNAYACDGKDIIRFPINDVAEEQIRAFVMREGGALKIAPISDDDAKYEFHNHKHRLSLISSSSHDDQNEEEEEEEEDSDDSEDEHKNGKKAELICDGCTTPIFQKKQRSSKKYYYMSCRECKYYLHMACFHLPPQLPSLPLHHQPNHKLVLQSRAKLDFSRYCNVCRLTTNGLFYTCTKCDFTADIKCASLPDTIYHAAHPQHLLNLKKNVSRRLPSSCAAVCDSEVDDCDCYECSNCDFLLHVRCATLPASVRWGKHQLPLTYDANVDHPGDIYCDHCEKQMNPKMWMYHCRPSDISFHPTCFRATSGDYRNIKFGQQYAINVAHPAPSHLSISHH